MKQLNIMAVTAVVLNLTLNLILIPRFGVNGAAITNVSIQCFTSLAQIILAIKIFNFKMNYSLLMRISVFLAALIITGMLVKHLPWDWYYSFGLFLALGAIYSFISRLFSFKSLFSILTTVESE
jgi:O-antigen/teichoic acid export membrane protein